MKTNKNTAGLVEYGSTKYTDTVISGDYDLFLFVHKAAEPDVEGLHFYVDDIPVDLNIRTIGWLGSIKELEGFDRCILSGRILYDPEGSISKMLTIHRGKAASDNCALSEDQIAMMRHGHTHIFDKIIGREESRPVLCKYLIHSNIYWLLQAYFSLRSIPFEGEKRAFTYLKEKDTPVYELFDRFYGTIPWEEQVAIGKELAEKVLAPAGGLWKKDEILAFGYGNSQELQKKGRLVFQQIFTN